MLRAQLGVILAPYGQIPGSVPSAIAYAYGGGGSGASDPDPQYNTQGQPGYFVDTMLGDAASDAVAATAAAATQLPTVVDAAAAAPSKLSFLDRFKIRCACRAGLGHIPTDAELSSMYNYQPVMSGEINAEQGFWPGSWVPPNGYSQGGPAIGFQGLREVAPVAPAVVTQGQPASVDDFMAAFNAHNDRVFTLALISTSAVAVSALITVFRTIKLIRSERGSET